MRRLIPTQRAAYCGFLRRHRISCSVSDYETLRAHAEAHSQRFDWLRSVEWFIRNPTAAVSFWKIRIRLFFG